MVFVFKVTLLSALVYAVSAGILAGDHGHDSYISSASNAPSASYGAPSTSYGPPGLSGNSGSFGLSAPSGGAEIHEEHISHSHSVDSSSFSHSDSAHLHASIGGSSAVNSDYLLNSNIGAVGGSGFEAVGGLASGPGLDSSNVAGYGGAELSNAAIEGSGFGGSGASAALDGVVNGGPALEGPALGGSALGDSALVSPALGSSAISVVGAPRIIGTSVSVGRPVAEASRYELQSVVQNVVRRIPIEVTRHVQVSVPHPVPVPVRKEVRVPVPQPYPVHVDVVKHVPYPVYKTQHVEVERPVPVEVVKQVPFEVIKKVHVPVERHVEVIKKVHVPIEKTVEVPVPVWKPYPIHIIKHVTHYQKKSCCW